MDFEITPADVRRKVDSGEAVRFIDVREPFEFAIAKIEGSELIPMRSIPQHLQQLDDGSGLLVVYCHHGVRSLSVVDWLRRQGVENCQSMAGGIDRWSTEIDPSIPRY